MLNENCTLRINEMYLEPTTLLKVFNDLIKQATEAGHQGRALPILFIEEGDVMKPGEWMAEIVFVVRQFVPQDNSEEQPNEPTVQQ